MKRLTIIIACLAALLLMSGCLSDGIGTSTRIPTEIVVTQRIADPITTPVGSPDNELLATDVLPTSIAEKPEFASTLDWWNEESERSKEIGDGIIEAIENYYVDKGLYPSTLGDLVPMYLSKIPKTITGHDFAFILHRPDYFTLKFPFTRRSNNKVQYTCGYSAGPNIIGEWECTHLLDYP